MDNRGETFGREFHHQPMMGGEEGMAAEQSEEGEGRGAESGSETNEAKSKSGTEIETRIESRGRGRKSEGARLLQGSQEGGAEYGIVPNKLYSINFVAELLSVEPKQIKWWIKKGIVEGFKLPNRAWRVRGSEIIALLERSRVR